MQIKAAVMKGFAWSLTSAAELVFFFFLLPLYVATLEKLCCPTSTSPATTWLISSQQLIPSSTKRASLTERLHIFPCLDFFSPF